MWDIVKKSLAFGIGAAVITGEKLREFVDDAVERGEMSKEEAKKFFDEVMKRGDVEKQNMQAWIRDQVNKWLREAGCVDKTAFDALERRIQMLEAKLSPTTEGTEDTEVTAS